MNTNINNDNNQKMNDKNNSDVDKATIKIIDVVSASMTNNNNYYYEANEKGVTIPVKSRTDFLKNVS
jgi:hypothetical protein